jgi:hypothetical protein
MLTLLRAFAKSPWAIGIIGLLVLAFALTGVGGVFTGTGTAVAIVGSERVSVNELTRAYERQIREIQDQDSSFTREQAEQFGIGDQVLNELVVLAAFSAKADEMGLVASGDALVNTAAGFEAFRNPATGRYDFDTLQETLRLNGYTVQQFEDDLYGDIVRGQLTATMAGGIAVPTEFATNRYRVSEERRLMRGLFIDASTADAIDDPTDEDLQNFIDENRNATDQLGLPLFMGMELRGITLVRFQLADFVLDVEVDEEPLRELYDYQLETGQLGTPATRGFVQLVTPDLETANAVVERLTAGETPLDIANALGLAAPFEQSESLAYQVPDNALADAVFAAAVGDIIAVEGAFATYAVQVTSGVDADIPSFEDQLPELRQAAAEEEALNVMYEKMGLFQEARDAGASLEEAAAVSGSPLEMFAPLDLLGRGDDRELNFARYNSLAAEILPLAFEQFEGFPTEMQQFNETDFYVVRVDSIAEARELTLDEVRDDAEVLWRQSQVGVQLQARAEEALAQLEAGEDLDIVSLTAGGRVEAATLQRDESAGQFAGTVIQEAFAAEPGEYLIASNTGENLRVILVVDEIIGADPGSAELGEIGTIRELIGTEIQGDIMVMAQNALLSEYGTDRGGIDAALVDQALGRDTSTGQ